MAKALFKGLIKTKISSCATVNKKKKWVFSECVSKMIRYYNWKIIDLEFTVVGYMLIKIPCNELSCQVTGEQYLLHNM